jgi:hypothetical protein
MEAPLINPLSETFQRSAQFPSTPPPIPSPVQPSTPESFQGKHFTITATSFIEGPFDKPSSTDFVGAGQNPSNVRLNFQAHPHLSLHPFSPPHQNLSKARISLFTATSFMEAPLINPLSESFQRKHFVIAPASLKEPPLINPLSESFQRSPSISKHTPPIPSPVQYSTPESFQGKHFTITATSLMETSLINHLPESFQRKHFVIVEALLTEPPLIKPLPPTSSGQVRILPTFAPNFQAHPHLSHPLSPTHQNLTPL